MATRQHRTSVAIQTNMLLQRKHLAQVARICKPTTATFPPKLLRSNDAVSRGSPCHQCFSKLLAPVLLSSPSGLRQSHHRTPYDPVTACYMYIRVLVICKDGLCVCSKLHTAVTPAMLVRLSFANDAHSACTAYGQPPKLRTTWG